MLRDPVQTALNEILVACEAAEAEHHRAAELLGEHPDGALFREIAQRRGAAAAEFRAAVVQHGDLPREPDPDHEFLREEWTQIKVAFSRNESGAVARDQLGVENRILDACRSAPPDMEAEYRGRIEALCADVRATEARLRKLAGD